MLAEALEEQEPLAPEDDRKEANYWAKDGVRGPVEFAATWQLSDQEKWFMRRCFPG